MAFPTCFRSFWCLFRIPFFTAGFGDDAKHKVAGAGGEERGGGGNQSLGKVTVNIFTKGERVVMHKDISAYPPQETWKLGNLATWQLGNLATWQLGNLAA